MGKRAEIGRDRARAGKASEPPCPAAQAPPDYLARLESLDRTYRRRRVQSEGGGADLGIGRGQEFVGYRPYRAGEDARALDFVLLARLGKPFVRSLRPEAHQEVTVLLDRSSSMAVGPPGKWQSAVEIALACAHLWGSLGAEVRIVHGMQGGAPETLRLRRARDWHGLQAQVFELQARGGLGLRELLVALRPGTSQVVLIGDLFDLQPHDLQPRLRGQTQWTVLRVLSPLETHPPAHVPTTWRDAEGTHGLVRTTGGADRQAYLERLAAWDAQWQSWCSHHRVGYRTHLAGTPFEEAFRGRFAFGGSGV